MTIQYNKDGWVCGRYPYNITADDENRFIEVSEEKYSETLVCTMYHAWRVINGQLIIDKYEEIPRSHVLQEQLFELKEKLSKYKQDIEQVELFGIERPDYAEKKIWCKNAVFQLKAIEKELNGKSGSAASWLN